VIRVNLLPHAVERRAAPETSQAWLVLVLLVVAAEVAGLFFFHQTKEDELAAATAEVNKIQTQISDINARVKNHANIKQELDSLRQREDAIAKLQNGRKGPTAVLLELSRILTRGKGPTVDPDKMEQLRSENPLAVFNPAWDTKRLWITNYDEDQRAVRVEGIARDASDVSEFAQRLRLSQYFEGVELKDGGDKRASTKSDEAELVKFALLVKVNY
jgi:type IV pilus assembly protein PilN